MKRAENGLCHASVALVFRAMSRVDGQVTLGWLERKSRQTYVGKEVSTVCKHIGLTFVDLYTGDACRIQVDVAWCTAQEDEQPSKRQRCGNRAITRGLCHGGFHFHGITSAWAPVEACSKGPVPAHGLLWASGSRPAASPVAPSARTRSLRRKTPSAPRPNSAMTAVSNPISLSIVIRDHDVHSMAMPF